MKLIANLFKVALFSLVFMSFSLNSVAQKINWLSFEDAIAKSEKNPKKIIIDIYTDWCKWCKVMDNNTFSNPIIAKYINDNYYAVKFNAEGTAPVNFKGHEFTNQNRGNRSPHDLAIALLNGKMGYPSYVFMNEKHEIITVVQSYLPPEKFEPMISFIEKELYLDGPSYEDYVKNFESKLD
ncbi:MAG: thioredoxin [Salinivirgaceae bacterium]|nr:MAG: thioredoxin [Salinivirgaceae bacterium]